LELDGEDCGNPKILKSPLKHVDLLKECTIKYDQFGMFNVTEEDFIAV
jgi:hypothetical protein